jgi:Mrp family chromosome partitioning ATPase
LPELLHLARQHFDMVIVDTPPMVNIADARVVGRIGDAVILVVRAGVTTRDAALVAMGRLVDDGIPVLGTILNFWNPKTPGYSYYGQYYAKHHYHYYGNGHNGNGSGGPADNDVPVARRADQTTALTRSGATRSQRSKVRPALENET